MSRYQILQQDVLKSLSKMPPNSYMACLSDPPYGLEFMNSRIGWDAPWKEQSGHFNKPDHKYIDGKTRKRAWPSFGRSAKMVGYQAWCFQWAQELYRVLVPGAPVLMFGGTRTYHRLACALEDAGFEVRDCLMMVYVSGFPKSLDLGKSLVKRFHAQREIISERKTNRTSVPGRWAAHVGGGMFKLGESTVQKSLPASDAARIWNGQGTALKPSYEPILYCQKPLDGSFAENALKWGCAGLAIDASRIGIEERFNAASGTIGRGGKGFLRSGRPSGSPEYEGALATGRWPANFMLDEGAAELLDKQSGESKSRSALMRGLRAGVPAGTSKYTHNINLETIRGHDDSGGASRFFFVEKAQPKERGSEREVKNLFGEILDTPNMHPTVKPIRMDVYLARLILPPPTRTRNLLVPFCGSGSEMIAAVQAGWDSVTGIERGEATVKTAKIRLFKHVGPA